MIVGNILSHSRFNGSPFLRIAPGGSVGSLVRRQPSRYYRGLLRSRSYPSPTMMAGIIIFKSGTAVVAAAALPIAAGGYDMKSSRFADRSSDWIMPAGWLLVIVVSQTQGAAA